MKDDLPDPNEPDEISRHMAEREADLADAAHAGAMAAHFYNAFASLSVCDDYEAMIHLTQVWMESGRA